MMIGNEKEAVLPEGMHIAYYKRMIKIGCLGGLT